MPSKNHDFVLSLLMQPIYKDKHVDSRKEIYNLVLSDFKWSELFFRIQFH